MHSVLVYDVIPSPISVIGFPDHVLIRNDGAVAFVESKAEGVGEEGLRALQVKWKRDLQKQNANWFLYNGQNEELEKWLENGK